LKKYLFKQKDMTVIKPIRTGLIALTLLLCIPLAFAQPRDNGAKPKQEKIEELKIAFITKELNLSPEEAQKFWPVYNEMHSKLKTEKKNQRAINKELRENRSTYSEAQFKNKSGAIMNSEIRRAELKKSYHDKIGGVIGYRKATKLLSLEQRFKRELLKRLNKAQKNPGNRGQRGGGQNRGGPNRGGPNRDGPNNGGSNSGGSNR
jgi:hypothetical protein